MKRAPASRLLLIILTSGCSEAAEPPTRATTPELTTVDANGTTQCVGNPGFLVDGDYEDVVVPPGESCEIWNSTITGYLRVLEGAEVLSVGNTIGNVEGVKAASVRLEHGRVEWNVRIVDGVGQRGGYRVTDVAVRRGHVRIVRNTGVIVVAQTRAEQGYIHVKDNAIVELLLVDHNAVGRNLEVFRNNGGEEKYVRHNAAAERISCRDNGPPFVAASNSAPVLDGQCAAPPAP